MTLLIQESFAHRCADPGTLAPIWHEALAPFERLALHRSPIWDGSGLDRGHGEPVVLVPGFLAGDSMLGVMHGWLKRLGYRPYHARIGVVVHCPELMATRLVATIEKAYRETGRPVRLIGHSLGGVIARGAAQRRPELVAQLITLGSPVTGVRAHPMVIALAQLFRGDCDGDCIDRMQGQLPARIDEVNIFSRNDAIVDPRTCVGASARRFIEVSGSHLGLIANTEVFAGIAGALHELRQPQAVGLPARPHAVAEPPATRQLVAA